MRLSHTPASSSSYQVARASLRWGSLAGGLVTEARLDVNSGASKKNEDIPSSRICGDIPVKTKQEIKREREASLRMRFRIWVGSSSSRALEVECHSNFQKSFTSLSLNVTEPLQSQISKLSLLIRLGHLKNQFFFFY